MDSVTDVLVGTMEGYAGRALNGYSYLMSSSDHRVFAVVSVGHVRDRHIVDTGLVARVAGDRVIVERDVNDKPLVDALLQAGIPRERIVLAYAGEVSDEAA
jgi:hypothetical protein